MAHKFSTIPALTILALALAQSAHATTKGLNQIPTPDLQPDGVLSLSVQQVHPQIDNATQFQTELGITHRFELATVQGVTPGEFRLGGEYSLVQNGPRLLSLGFLNWSTRGVAPEPFLEAGYYQGANQWMAGAMRVGGGTDGLLGVAHIVSPTVLLSADYQGGAANYSTAGITFTIKQNKNSIVFNPAIYVSNTSKHSAYGYAVLTYNIALKN